MKYYGFKVYDGCIKFKKYILSTGGTCGDRRMSTKGGYVEILEFTHFSRVFRFNHTGEIGRKKEIFHEIKVSVVMELV